MISRDKMGNRCQVGGAHVTCGSMVDKDPLQSSCTDKGDGTYKGQLTMALAGEYALAVKLRGSHARGSPHRSPYGRPGDRRGPRHIWPSPRVDTRGGTTVRPVGRRRCGHR